jgi:hypothetical protein
MCKVLNAQQVGKRPAADRVYVGRPRQSEAAKALI